MMSHRILPAAILLCALAACGENPAGSDTHAQPAGPAYDGGFTMGSGNSAMQSSGYATGSGDSEIKSGGLVTGPGNEATKDGGVGLGSGNVSIDGGGYGIGAGNSVLAGDAAVGSNGTTPTDSNSDDTASRGGFTMGSGN